MPIKNYHLVVGRPTDWTLDHDSNPHIEVLMDVANEKFRAAINVRSSVPPHTLIYQRVDPFRHDMIQTLETMNPGVYDIRNDHPNLAFDYPRDGILKREDMLELPYRRRGPNNDLLDYLLPAIKKAIHTPGTLLYLFGETWGPEDKEDKYFGFQPGRGIHDIHMNQGSAGAFEKYNGIHQDGALVIRKPSGDWVAIFLAFTSQSWNTDSQGNTIEKPEVPVLPPTSEPSVSPIQIVAALINPYNPEEDRESVSLINISDESVSLNGWRLEDDNCRSKPLDGYEVGAGDVIRVKLAGSEMRLKNSGGEIRLVASPNHVIQEIHYDESKAKPEGWTARF